MNLAVFQHRSKTFIVIAFLLVGLGVILAVGAGARQYFATASQCPAQKTSISQVGSTSAIVSWETEDVSQGTVEYGTSNANLAFSAPEGSSGKLHTLPLTLLTPSTVYYYVVKIGDVTCDSTGETCQEGSCIPFSFTTNTAEEGVTQTDATPSASPSSAQGSGNEPSPTSGASAFCKAVQSAIGTTSKATDWESQKQYDVDNNGIINGKDMIKCIQLGK